jgi:Predicted Rossmann fold nucleotide-binding protein involved in DNA uptake
MVAKGGLLSEFPSNTEPDRYNFVKRNRIVAGIADAVIVVESDVKGGSLITAKLRIHIVKMCLPFREK